MACEYKSRGEHNHVTTQIFQFVEDFARGEMSTEFPDRQIEWYDVIDHAKNVLEEAGVITRTTFGDYIIDYDNGKGQSAQAIRDVNDTAKKYFGTSQDMIRIAEWGDRPQIFFTNEVVKNLYPVSDDIAETQTSSIPHVSRQGYEEAENQQDPVEEPAGLEEDEMEREEEAADQSVIDEVFARKNEKDNLTEQILHNLTLQIERLERLQQTEPVKRRANEIKVLKKKLSRVNEDVEKLDDYFDFVRYTIDMAERGQKFLDKIEVEYAYDYKSMTQEKRAEMLKDISDLKETLDAFYNKVSSRSISSLLLRKIEEMDDPSLSKDELILELTDAITSMAKIDQRYLDIGIPIQADYLMSFAPIEINEQLEERIKFIRDNKRMSGIRIDKEYRAIRKNKSLSLEEKREKLLELNIKQLQQKKIGREMIINELRATHTDASQFSMLADPLIYSSEPAIQMFALALKEKMIEANQASIDMKYRLVDSYRKFRDWKGVGEDRPDKLYEDMYEVITEYVRDETTGEYLAREVLSFVQEFNMTKFNKAQNEAFIKFRKDFAFPTDPSTYDEYFKSEIGRKYLEATAKWYEDNTDAIEGWEDISKDMDDRMDSLMKQITAAYRNGEISKAMGLQNEFNGLEYEYKKLFRNGKPIGRLTKPKASKYSNPKFTSMPAPAKEFYNILLDEYKQSQSLLGRNAQRKNSWDDFSYVLPTIRKSAYDKGREDGWFNSLGDALKEGTSFQETDTEYGELVKANGEPLKVIPRYYTNYITPTLVSKDIVNSIIKFGDMAHRYKAKGQLAGVVNIMQSAVANRELYTMSSTGETLYTSVAQRFGYKVAAPKDGKDSNTYKQLMAFIDSFYYGREEKARAARILGREVSANKMTGFASTGVALSTLSFNLLQSVNQVVIDTAMGSQESLAGQFYSYSDHLWARKKLHGMGRSLGLAKTGLQDKFTKQSKIGKMIEMFDAFQELGGQFGKEAGSTFKKNLTLGNMFILQRGAEASVTTTKLLALARSYKGKLKDSSGKVLLNEAGEEADLWDMLIEDKNGKLMVDPRVANFNIAKFSAKFHGMVRRTNQLKGDFDKTALERQWYGKAVTLFRKYFVPGMRKRFGHSQGSLHTDIELGQVTEGYYATVRDMLLEALYEFRTGSKSEAIKIAFGKGASRQQKFGLRRAAYELAFATLTFVIGKLVGAMLDDDDDKDSWVLNMIAYQALRANTEMLAFANPYEFWRIVENPTATANFMKNTLDLVLATGEVVGYQLGVVPAEDVFYQRKAGPYAKGDAKWVKEFMDWAPGPAGIMKSLLPEEAIQYYNINK